MKGFDYMDEKFYTIDQIAETLGMHHKTIRKFITEGRLRARKVGKQWRISGHDLSIFMEDNNVTIRKKSEKESDEVEFSTNNLEENNCLNNISISTVVDIKDIDTDEYRRISNMLLAVMNTKDSKMNNATINIKYYQNENNLKIMLWGHIEFIKEMLDFICILTKNNEKY